MELPGITTRREEGNEGFQAILLGIQGHSRDQASGCHRIQALGRYRQTRVGLEIAVYPDWIVFHTMGEPSNRLVLALAELWGVRGRAKMRREIAFVIEPLRGEPENVATHPLDLKVFPASRWTPPWAYFEFYVNIDVTAGEVELREKDEQYRFPIIVHLSGNVLGWLKLPVHLARGWLKVLMYFVRHYREIDF